LRRAAASAGEALRNALWPPEPAYWRQATPWRVLVGLMGVAGTVACLLVGTIIVLHGMFGSDDWLNRLWGTRGGGTDVLLGSIVIVSGALLAQIVRYVISSSIEPGHPLPTFPSTHIEDFAPTDPLVGAFPLGARRGKEEILYLASTTSQIFHRPSCRHAQKISRSHRRVFSSRERALRVGLRPCSACRP